MNNKPGWQSLSFQWIKDFQLFLFILLSLTLFRVLLLLLYGNQVGDESSWHDFLSVFWMGFRLDMGSAAAWVLITFLLSLLCLKFSLHNLIIKARSVSAHIYVIFGILLLGIDIIFFRVYGDHYNQMVLGLLYDDGPAIAKTIWKEHHPLLYLTLFFFVIYLLRKPLLKWLNYDLPFTGHFSRLEKRAHKFFATSACLFLVLIAMRGGDVSGAPLQMRHVFVTHDDFLNRAILNPFFALRQTIKNQMELNSKNGLNVYWDPKDLPNALALASNHHELNIDQAFNKVTTGEPKNRPRHVFLILMESYSGWTLMPQYRNAGFSNGLGQFLDKGVLFSNFLPATRATADSLSVLVSGIPYAGLNINHESMSLKEYPSSIAKIFNDLGYHTRFIYGGYIGWQRLDTFIKAQGFKEIKSASNMTNAKRGNEWGIDDEYLFDYLEELITDDTPSFNFILSTTSHSPYDLDLEQQGFPMKQFPPGIEAGQNNALEVMGHHWYADRELGKFISVMNQKLTNPLFAVTGDHPTRVRLKFQGQNLLEQRAVPFFLYAPGIIDPNSVNTHVAGSHIDITDTLVALSAPKNFHYVAFGNNMFEKSDADVGFGKEFIIGSNFMASIKNPESVINFSNTPAALNPEQRSEALKKINAKLALSWYRIRNGSQLSNSQD